MLEYKVGDKVTVEVFGVGEHVDVIGTSKGKGFAGVVKRYHFAGGPKTHGASDRLRAPGSNGSTTTPGRVYKGSRRPGHMGHERVTAQSLKVVLVDAERNLLGVRWCCPRVQRRSGRDSGSAQAVSADDGSIGYYESRCFQHER